MYLTVTRGEKDIPSAVCLIPHDREETGILGILGNGYRSPDEKSSLPLPRILPLCLLTPFNLSKKKRKGKREESVSPGVPARKLRPIRIRQALFKVTSCHFFSPVAAIGSVDRCIRFSNPPSSTPLPSPRPPFRPHRAREPLVAPARREDVRGRVYTCTRTRAHEGGLTSGRLYPEYPPRCLAQWGLSSLILSAGEPGRRRREEENREASRCYLLPRLERDKSLKAAANYDDTTGIRECQDA